MSEENKIKPPSEGKDFVRIYLWRLFAFICMIMSSLTLVLFMSEILNAFLWYKTPAILSTAAIIVAYSLFSYGVGREIYKKKDTLPKEVYLSFIPQVAIFFIVAAIILIPLLFLLKPG